MKILGSGEYVFKVWKITKDENGRSRKTPIGREYDLLIEAIDDLTEGAKVFRISLGWEKDEFEIFDKEGNRLGFISWSKITPLPDQKTQPSNDKYLFRATRPTGWTGEYNNVEFYSLFEAIRTIQYFITIPELSHYYDNETDRDGFIVSDMEGNPIGTLLKVDD
jgi:hypothetical protein